MEGSNKPNLVDPTWSDTSYYHNMLNDLGWSDDLQQHNPDLRDSRLAHVDEYQPSISSQPTKIKSTVRDDLTTRSSEPAPVSSSSSEDPTEKSTTTTTTTVAATLNKVKQKGQKRVRQQRFAFMTKSEVDHLEDGYRWRKYGQKAVKNSPFPRSYYRCTNTKCTVKKRVERSSEDTGVVITTYEGQHCHHAVGYPRSTGFINHDGVSVLAHFGSSFNTSQFFYPQFHHQTSFLSNNNNNNTHPQPTSSLTSSHVPQRRRQQLQYNCSTNKSPPRSSGDDQGQGLLGDIVPPLMRNPSDIQ